MNLKSSLLKLTLAAYNLLAAIIVVITLTANHVFRPNRWSERK